MARACKRPGGWLGEVKEGIFRGFSRDTASAALNGMKPIVLRSTGTWGRRLLASDKWEDFRPARLLAFPLPPSHTAVPRLASELIRTGMGGGGEGGGVSKSNAQGMESSTTALKKKKPAMNVSDG